MSLHCPRAHSPKVAPFNHTMKVGAAIGTIGGIARGVSALLAGGQLSARSLVLLASTSDQCRVPSSAAWPVA